MESGNVTRDEHLGIRPFSWRTRSREKFHTAWKKSPQPHRRHLRSFSVCTFSIVRSSSKAGGSASLLLLYTSLTHSIVNHSRRQLNYSKVTEVQASYQFCNQQLLSQKQAEQIGLLRCQQAGQRWGKAP